MYVNLKSIFWYSYMKKNHGFYLYTFLSIIKPTVFYKSVEYESYVIKKSQAVNDNNWYEINSNQAL